MNRTAALLALLGALIVAVGSLAAVLAQDLSSVTTDTGIAAAQSTSRLDQPTSECSEGVVVFADNFGAGELNYQSTYVDLPQGVYLVQLYASARSVSWDWYSAVRVIGWDAGGGEVSNTNTDTKRWRIGRPGEPTGADGSVARRLIPIPGGITRVTLELSSSVMQRASQWRWEIVAPGVCKMPGDSESDS